MIADKTRRVRDKLQDPRFECLFGDTADPKPEYLQRTTYGVLDIVQLIQELLAIDQGHANLLRLLALDVDLPEPSKAEKLCDTSRVVAVSLVPHGAQTRLDMPAFEADGWIACLAQRAINPGRGRARFKPDALERSTELAQHR